MRFGQLKPLSFLIIALIYTPLLFPQTATNSAQLQRFHVEVAVVGPHNDLSEEILVEPKETIMVRYQATNQVIDQIALPHVLQLVWRRLGEDTWTVSSIHEAISHSVNRGNMTLVDVPLGSTFDQQQSLELIAVISQTDKMLPDGVIDLETIRFLSVGMSQRVQMFRLANPVTQLYVTPRIRIMDIDDRAATPGVAIEVGLQSILHGEFRQPTGSRIRIVVQPLHQDGYYVSSNAPLIREGEFFARVDLTGEGFDEEHEFIVFAIVSRHDLPLDERILPDLWERFKATHISAISTPILLRRVELPLAENQITVAILSVDGNSAYSKSVRNVASVAGVKGMVTGRPVSREESIWILASAAADTADWRVIASATRVKDHYWEMSPHTIGPPGVKLQVIAVVSTEDWEPGDQLSLDQVSAYSTSIHVGILDSAPLQVLINRVDEKRPSAELPVHVFPICGIEGQITGREPTESEKVFVLKREDDAQKWELLGRANFTSTFNWLLPPLALGESGDDIALLAVVARDQFSAENLANQGLVAAASRQVYVSLSETR